MFSFILPQTVPEEDENALMENSVHDDQKKADVVHPWAKLKFQNIAR